jgi:hypothetical protein
MRVFAVRIEHPLDMSVQGPHDADASEHCRAIAFRDKKQKFDRGPPFLELLFGRRQLLDISAGILEGDKLAAAGQRDRIFEFALPTPIANDANPALSATRAIPGLFLAWRRLGSYRLQRNLRMVCAATRRQCCCARYRLRRRHWLATFPCLKR